MNIIKVHDHSFISNMNMAHNVMSIWSIIWGRSMPNGDKTISQNTMKYQHTITHILDMLIILIVSTIPGPLSMLG